MSKEKPTHTDVSEYGEFRLIEHLTKNFEIKNAYTLKGVSDDAALIDNQGNLTVVSTDMLIEGIHFDLMYFPLKHLGYKAVISNLSDIYAMNGMARQITFSIAVSNRFSVEALEELYEGVHHACERYEVDLVGGDTSSSTKGIFISVTALGEVAEERVVYRNTARPGDLICLSGNLGSAFLGLQILEREKQIFLENPDIQPDLEGKSYIIGRQLKPEARRDVIIALDQAGILPTSMIDVSDGLSSDLMHICHQSGTGAIIHEEAIAIHPEAYDMALKFNMDPINAALSGGEDYELLFTIRAQDREVVEQIPDIAIIGEILDSREKIRIHTKGGHFHELVASGWQAFSQ